MSHAFGKKKKDTNCSLAKKEEGEEPIFFRGALNVFELQDMTDEYINRPKLRQLF